MTTSQRLEYCRQIFERLRIVQQRNRYIGSASDSELTLSESHILVEIDGSPGVVAKDLARILRMEKSTLSRCLAGLIKRKHINTSVSVSDARERPLTITEAGKRVLETFDKSINFLTARQANSLTVQEEVKLRNYFKALADGYDVAIGVQRPEDHPLRMEIRRVTRALGVLGDNFMGLGLTSMQWQILTELSRADRVIVATQLCEILAVAANTMSLTLKNMQNLGLVTVSKHASDGRSRNLRLSTKGNRMLMDVGSAAAKRFNQALSDLSLEDLREFDQLLQRYSSLRQVRGSIVIQEKIDIRKLDSVEERSQARGFLIANLLRLNLQDRAPEVLLGKDSYSYALYRAERICGLCELQPSQGDFIIASFATDTDLDNSDIARNFCRAALRDFFERNDVSKVRIAEGIDILGTHIILRRDLR